jgi:hypothetical protein
MTHERFIVYKAFSRRGQIIEYLQNDDQLNVCLRCIKTDYYVHSIDNEPCLPYRSYSTISINIPSRIMISIVSS